MLEHNYCVKLRFDCFSWLTLPEILYSTEPSWSVVMLWYFLSTYYFYCTGHQATIPAIRFEAAFVGFPAGDGENIVLPGNGCVYDIEINYLTFLFFFESKAECRCTEFLIVY